MLMMKMLAFQIFLPMKDGGRPKILNGAGWDEEEANVGGGVCMANTTKGHTKQELNTTGMKCCPQARNANASSSSDKSVGTIGRGRSECWWWSCVWRIHKGPIKVGAEHNWDEQAGLRATYSTMGMGVRQWEPTNQSKLFF